MSRRHFTLTRCDDNIVMPAFTLTDIITHPAYKKYILDVSVEDIERMRTVVSVHDNWQRITDLTNSYGLSIQVSVGDKERHYKECVWANPDCKEGPDTCICCYISRYCYEIVRNLNALR